MFQKKRKEKIINQEETKNLSLSLNVVGRQKNKEKSITFPIKVQVVPHLPFTHTLYIENLFFAGTYYFVIVPIGLKLSFYLI